MLFGIFQVSTDLAGDAAIQACKEILDSMPNEPHMRWDQRVSKATKLSAIGKVTFLYAHGNNPKTETVNCY